MSVSPEEFRRALGHFASGVTVVTTCDEQQRPRGITVSAFSSLSLDPPLVLVCIDNRAPIHDLLTAGRHYAVNILAEDQESVSRRFASKESERFEGLGYDAGTTGAPLLNGAMCTIECSIREVLPGGDHSIVVGQVQATHVTERKPLLYYRGGYNQLA